MQLAGCSAVHTRLRAWDAVAYARSWPPPDTFRARPQQGAAVAAKAWTTAPIRERATRSQRGSVRRRRLIRCRECVGPRQVARRSANSRTALRVFKIGPVRVHSVPSLSRTRRRRGARTLPDSWRQQVQPGRARARVLNALRLDPASSRILGTPSPRSVQPELSCLTEWQPLMVSCGLWRLSGRLTGSSSSLTADQKSSDTESLEMSATL